MKKCLTFIALACVGMMTAGTASAQAIPGTFFAVNSSNTELQDGGAFSDVFGFNGLWSDRSGLFNIGTTFDIHQLDGNGNSGDGSGGAGGGFLGNASGGVADGSIVTSLSGLAAGDYEVRFIYSSLANANNIQYATGFSADNTTQIQDALNNGAGFQAGSEPFAERYNDVGFVNPSSSNLTVNGSLIGTTTVTAGEDLQIFTDNLADVFQGQQNALQGFSVVLVSSAVPEPSSLALLGLASGLGLLRRRR